MQEQVRVVLWRMRHVIEGRERTCTLVGSVRGWHLAITEGDSVGSEHHRFPDEPSARIHAARTAIALSERGWIDARTLN